MTDTKANLAKVLDNLQTNRQNLVTQIAQGEAQVEQMRTQLPTFDSAIAALQVAITDPDVYAQIEVQANMNATVPLTAPASDEAPSSAGSERAAA